MNVTAILGIIAQIPKLVEAVTNIVEEAKANLSTEDVATLEAALVDLQKKNDASFERVSNKLKAAAEHNG